MLSDSFNRVTTLSKDPSFACRLAGESPSEASDSTISCAKPLTISMQRVRFATARTDSIRRWAARTAATERIARAELWVEGAGAAAHLSYKSLMTIALQILS
jgi:hypothetical protein